ncbi:hypothetical protein B296_00008519 [Ensete ventricosum]|uniref:Uncharacterized protein n=1 Tax=Ensete ventricosum TaxID=4639 RepID=A0A426Y7Y6_ENSVE|nr:hypothetical protein B296_00008519 [Ensete ventricosum]
MPPIYWKERSPASSLDTDLLEGAVSCFLPQHRSVITLQPGQIARLHCVRPCVAASRAPRTIAYPVASPSSAMPRGTTILQSPYIQKAVDLPFSPPHLPACHNNYLVFSRSQQLN